MSAPIVRRLEPADLAEFRRLRLDALAAAPAAFGSSPEEDAALSDAAVLARLADPAAIFGGFVDGGLVGIAGFAPERGLKRQHRGLLWGVYVASRHRRSGLGQALVAAVVAHAAPRVLVLTAAVGEANGPARALYEGLGFVPYGLERRALRVGDVFHDEVLIALELPGA